MVFLGSFTVNILHVVRFWLNVSLISFLLSNIDNLISYSILIYLVFSRPEMGGQSNLKWLRSTFYLFNLLVRLIIPNAISHFIVMLIDSTISNSIEFSNMFCTYQHYWWSHTFSFSAISPFIFAACACDERLCVKSVLFTMKLWFMVHKICNSSIWMADDKIAWVITLLEWW